VLFKEGIKENIDLWHKLSKTKKPIVLYGMGNGAEKVIKYLNIFGKTPDGVFASDDFVRGQEFLGYKVKKYSDFVNEYGNFVVLVAFGTQVPDVISNILRIAEEQETYAPNVPLFGEGLFDYAFFDNHFTELETVYNNLADEKSQNVFLDICNYNLSGKIGYLMNACSEKYEIFDLLDLNNYETYLDLGAYNGDTVIEFAEITKDKYKQILAVEPDGKNFKKLLANTENYHDITHINFGIWQENTELFFSSKAGRNSALSLKGNRSVQCLTIDEIQDKYAQADISYIKMDVEGVEKQAIVGGKNTIINNKPKMAVSAYHRNEDLYLLPLLLWQYNSNYKIYFRHQLYIPGWENNFYCI
jgi:FkbM family methyltransferase